MEFAPKTKLILVLTAVSIAAGAAIANYADEVVGMVFDPGNQPAGESSGLPRCPPHSVNVESLGEMANGPNVGLSPRGVICSFDR